MARQVFSRTHRAVLWTLTGNWRTRTLPADNLDNPVVYLLAKGLAEVVDGRLQATRAGYELRKQIEREQAATGAARVSAWSCVPGNRASPVERRHSLGQTGLRPGRAACRCQSVRWRVISLISAEPFASGLSPTESEKHRRCEVHSWRDADVVW
jgi:hypothetical protein